VKAFLARHKSLKILLNVIVIVLVLLLLKVYGQRGVVEGEAPGIAGQLVDGQQVELSQYRGAPVLVHFWASWCGICRLEEGGIDAIARDYPVITVAMQSGRDDEIRGYLQKQGLSFPTLADPQGEIASEYGIKGVPASFIVDAKGSIRFVEVGYTTETGLRLRLWLARWLSF